MLEKGIQSLRKYEIFNKLISDDMASQLKKYLIIGFSTFIIEYTIFTTFNYVIFSKFNPWGYKFINSLIHKNFSIYDYKYILSNSIALFIVFWFNFLMNRFWAFESKMKLTKQIGMYGILFVFNIFATNFLMYIFSGFFGIWPAISKIIIMGFVVCWNFILYKKIIYK